MVQMGTYDAALGKNVQDYKTTLPVQFFTEKLCDPTSHDWILLFDA
jgi:hypothetical protein